MHIPARVFFRLVAAAVSQKKIAELEQAGDWEILTGKVP